MPTIVHITTYRYKLKSCHYYYLMLNNRNLPTSILPQGQYQQHSNDHSSPRSSIWPSSPRSPSLRTARCCLIAAVHRPESRRTAYGAFRGMLIQKHRDMIGSVIIKYNRYDIMFPASVLTAGRQKNDLKVNILIIWCTN